MKNTEKFILILLACTFLPTIAYANAGVPMIYLSYPVMLMALIPIVLFESFLCAKLMQLTIKKSILPCTVANTTSTVAGFPLAWGLLLGLESITTEFSCGPGFDTTFKSVITVIVEAAWLCPWEEQLFWMIPIAFVISLLVAFFLSLLIEFLILRKFHKNFKKREVWKATYLSNLSSYAILVLLSFVYLGISVPN